MTPRPPDRSHLLTERSNDRSETMHRMDVEGLVALIQSEDATVPAAVARARGALVELIRAAEPRFTSGGRLVYLGAGTSGRLGVLDASEAPPTFQVEPGRVVGIIAGGDRALRRSSEGLEDDPEGARAELESLGPTRLDTIIGLASGGTTRYVLGGLAIAKRLAPDSLTALLCCAPIDRPPACDHLVILETGPELLTGSTRMKAGTATKLALNTISTVLMVRSGKIYRNLMVDVRATNDKLRDRAARIVGTLTGLDRDASFALLDRAGGSVKTAVVMHALALDREAAEARLAAAGGRLDRVLEG